MSALLRPSLLKTLELRKVITASLIVSNRCSEDNILVSNSLIAPYSTCAVTESAHHVFDQMHKRNTVLWSALMSGHFQNGFEFEVLKIFKSMVSEQNESSLPNEYTSTLVLTSCTKVGYVLFGRQCHGYLLKSGLEFHQYVKSGLLQLYCMLLSDMVGAVEVLVSIPEADNYPYHKITVGPGEKCYFDEAFNMLRKMLAEDMVWNKATYIGLFGLCGRLSDFNLARQVHNKLLKSQVEFDVSVSNALIKMYGKCGRGLLSSVKVFVMHKDKNAVSWTSIIDALLQSGLIEESFIIFDTMLNDDVVLNESTFCLILDASARLFSTRCGNLLHALTIKKGFKGDKDVEDALISMYFRTGDINSAKKMFSDMTYCDILTLDMMIRGYNLHRFGNESLSLFHEMLKSGKDPNDDIFVGVLNACGDLRLVEEGFHYFYELMKSKGLEPDLEHYKCIVNILIKDKRLKEAIKFMESSPIKWDHKTWTTMLRACHRNRLLYDHVTELIPNNMIVSEWCWSINVYELIKIKHDEPIEPGLSWVEISNTLYNVDSVVKGDARFVEHHEMMKALFDSIEDEIMEKECDGYHSEKLAVGYALLNTHEAAPICVIMKKGKMCDDCHSFMKLMSKAKKKVITVKDSKCFHHFEDGSCSCADYW